MRLALGFAASLGLAAAFATPAPAQSSSGTAGFNLSAGDPAAGWVSGVRVHRGFGDGRGDGRHRRGDRIVIGDLGYGYGGEWALYNNRSWRPGSYNDWWHDRPDRSFPRWMSRNEDCARPWYSADTLRC